MDAETVRSNYEARKRFFENIKILAKSEYEEIFRILKKYNEPYAENSNGIFFDVNVLTEDSFHEMNEYMNFCLRHRAEQEDRIKEMQEIRTEQDIMLHTHEVSEENE
jgi:hypothetical protein